MAGKFTESVIEDVALDWLEGLGYSVVSGPDLASGESAAERQSFGDVVLINRLRSALSQINPQVSADAIDEAVRKVLRTETPSLIKNNRWFHRLLVDGIDVQYVGDGAVASG